MIAMAITASAMCFNTDYSPAYYRVGSSLPGSVNYFSLSSVSKAFFRTLSSPCNTLSDSRMANKIDFIFGRECLLFKMTLLFGLWRKFS